MIITQHENPAEYAPTFFFNHCGRMPWSGRNQADFNSGEVVALLQFCEQEGARQGHNDAKHDRIGTREEAPFHEAFLGGYPKQLWENGYWEGVEHHSRLQELALLDSAELDDADDDMETRYERIVTDQQLLDALPHDGEFGLSRVQRLTRWSYSEASAKLNQFVSRALIAPVEGKLNRYVMAPNIKTESKQHAQ